MLFAASKSIRGASALNDVVREMSLSLSYFGSPEALAELMAGESRRLVLLAASDIEPTIVRQLRAHDGKKTFAVIVAADRRELSKTVDPELMDRLIGIDNLEWVGTHFDYERLAASARRCRRRMLRLTRSDLEKAFENLEFALRYQPKVERTATEWVTTEVEALVRWQHPEHGLMGPLEFLPEVEAFAMMDELTLFVLRKAAGQLAEWRKSGLELNGCVNLAPSLLNDPSIADRYEDAIAEFGMGPGNFTFEVVEQDLENPHAPHLQTIHMLREKRFRLCLDDFRVAASSLSTFEKLPFDEIKLHASALKRAQNDPVSLQVLAAVNGLAHNLGMSVCAEGVETEETFEFLKQIGCDKLQGFFISEAVLPHIIRQVYTAEASRRAS